MGFGGYLFGANSVSERQLHTMLAAMTNSMSRRDVQSQDEHGNRASRLHNPRQPYQSARLKINSLVLFCVVRGIIIHQLMTITQVLKDPENMFSQSASASDGVLSEHAIVRHSWNSFVYVTRLRVWSRSRRVPSF